MLKIIPAILAKNLADFEEDFNKVKARVGCVQVDIVDGVFAPDRTLWPEELEAIDTIVEFDMHLMVDEPHKWIERCVRGGANRIFGQVERMSNKSEFLAEVQVAGLAAGLAIDIETPVAEIEEVIWDLDAVLMMSVKAGAQGQSFDERVLEKIEEVRAMRNDLIICVDGGLNVENIKRCIAAEWAEEIKEGNLRRNFLDIEFAVGADIFGNDDALGELENLKHLRSET